MAIRINPAGTVHYGEDVTAIRNSATDFIILAKAETPKEVHDAGWLMSVPVLAMIETPTGVVDAAAIAPTCKGLIAGTNDLSHRLGLPGGEGRVGLVYALQRIVLAARAAGVVAFDGVYNGLEADAGLEAECAQGRGPGVSTASR